MPPKKGESTAKTSTPKKTASSTAAKKTTAAKDKPAAKKTTAAKDKPAAKKTTAATDKPAAKKTTTKAVPKKTAKKTTTTTTTTKATPKKTTPAKTAAKTTAKPEAKRTAVKAPIKKAAAKTSTTKRASRVPATTSAPKYQEKTAAYTQASVNSYSSSSSMNLPPKNDASPKKTQDAQGKSIASMVLGILALLASWTGYGALVAMAIAIVGLLLGISAKKIEPNGKATAGIVCSIVALVLSAIFFFSCVICVAGIGAAASTYDYSYFY